MEQVVVKIDNLVKRYKELIALDHFSLEIREGEIFGLLGPNGSGKTTTINCLLSLLSFDKGSIQIFGKEMSPVRYDIKRQIGVIMQNVAVFQELTVYENIDYFCGLYIRDKAARKQYVMDAVHFTGKISEILSKKAFWRFAATVKYCLWHCTQTKADYFGRTNRCG